MIILPVHSDMPEFEPRGCPRGASFSWYEYSPLRVKYPYMRGKLWRLWKEARKTYSSPVRAWASIVESPEKAQQYKQARGKGGHIRVKWDDALELISAQLIYTIQTYTRSNCWVYTHSCHVDGQLCVRSKVLIPFRRTNAQFL